jgi:hypothetical protein
VAFRLAMYGFWGLESELLEMLEGAVIWYSSMITKIRNQKLDTHICSKRHEFSDVSIEPPKNPQLLHSTEQSQMKPPDSRNA